MFKPEDYSEFKSLISSFDWNLLTQDPNTDPVQDWVASIYGILWEFDSPSAEEFQKKIKTLVNMWGGVRVGNFPSSVLEHDLSDIKQFLRIKAEGMKRLKDTPKGPVGILNEGQNNTFDSNTFSGLQVGILDRGSKSRSVGNKFTSGIRDNSKPSFNNIKISGGTVVFGDGAKITQVAVRELVEALRDEIQEKVPESKEKKNVLGTLKEITTNETFASVAGTVIGEILRRVTRP
ncbi:MAG: hypothetical protein NTZ07_03915 [Candidatus Woesebacteria bacterium]|nr:hypothetical protein [Candidatus Woesebacteria bacterium]